jgi:DNA-binding CsgD family transcriptional regulator
MVFEIVGREGELASVGAFVGGDRAGPVGLVLEGDPGIGKSTLWLRGLELARDRGLRVLSSRPAEAEREFAFTGLGDLFDGLLDEVLPALPPPRRRALEVALLLAEAQDPLAPRALAVAVRSALELLVEAQSPLVLAVDDAQWLDGSSAEALAFALRRTSAPIYVLLARRAGTQTNGSRLESALPAPSVEHMHVDPLSVGALHAVVRGRLDRVFSRPTLLRIHETSGGNPFYALEIARALPDELDPQEPLPIPDTLEALVRARIDALPQPSRQALVLLSALGEADAATLRSAGLDIALQEAVSRGIVARAGNRLRFAHPLLASSVYQRADEATRRSSHAVLAETVRDPLERARHLARAAQGPDAEIAASLDEAASFATLRGAPPVAAELNELARGLTPDGDRDGRHRRAIVAATSHLRAGDARRARSLAEETLAEATEDRHRAEALVLMSAVEGSAGSRASAIALRRRALSQARSHPALQAAVHQWLAANLPPSEGVRIKERHARTSLELAEHLDDDALRAGALAVLASLRFEAGEPDALELAERAYALVASRATRDERAQPGTELAHLLAWTSDRLNLLASFVLADILVDIGRFDAARALLDGLERELAQRDEFLEAQTLLHRSFLEFGAGRWSLAHELAQREREIAALYEKPFDMAAFPFYAELALHRGEFERARELAAHGRELAVGYAAALTHAEAVLGLVNRAVGDLVAATAHFACAEDAAETCGRREPTTLWWRADFAEALLELGRVDDAAELLDAWEPDARRLGRDRVIAHVTRCRGLVAAARGDIDLALGTLEQAVDQSEGVADSFGHARALLALGVMRRRARQKRGARETIEAALAGFEQLGEVPWSERARDELGRVSGRRRKEGLTPAERRVAALVAEGRTNREIAAGLFLSERTVASHLTHIYAKLDVRSRTELVRRLHAAEQTV